MENIFSAIKLLIPLLLTPIINRFISTFRVRQLYLAFEETLPCTLPNTDGFLTCLHIYNKGKDKETKVEITLPNSSLCQILSSNYPSSSTELNRVLIDRILPGQIITIIVYFKSTTPISKSNKPFIKSEDANGRAFDDRTKVPPSLGPAVLGISLMSAVLITFMYIVLSGSNLLYPYYALRYNSFMEQGFTPESFSDNQLISHASITSKPPININKPYIENSQIILPLKIKNITNEKVSITFHHQLSKPNKDEYSKEKDRVRREISDLSERIEAWRLVDAKYGYHSDDVLLMSDIVLEPNEEKTILLSHTIIPTTTLENFNFKILIEKGIYDGKSFTDFYNFNVQDSKELPKFIELLESLQR